MPSTDPYDRVAYGSRPLPEAHPDRLWVVGRLFGTHPPDPATARVLELGCGAGVHLATIAARRPNTRCVGVDRAAAPIALARRTAARLGATNVTFLQADLSDLDGVDGEFDYVIAHGVYSWVDAAVRDALLARIGRVLAPGGLAYVSYNVHPGWHLRGMLSEMLRFHAQGFDAPEKQIGQARALLRFLSEVVPDSDPYGAWLRREARLVDAQPDAWVFHDLLAERNDAVLVSEFVAHAHRHGLAYVGDADVASMLPDRLPASVRQALERLGADAVRAEQYLDFVLCRNFRRSLLCRPGTAVDRTLSWDRLRDLAVRGQVQSEGQDDDGGEVFRTRAGDTLSTSVPLLIATLNELGRADPGAVPFEILVDRARQRAGTDDADADRAMVGRNLLACFARGLVSFETGAEPIASAPSERPRAEAVIRALAPDGEGVPSLLHEWVSLEALDTSLLPLLDGTRTVDALVVDLADELTGGGDRGPVDAFLRSAVPERLQRYAAAGLLDA